MGRNPNNIEGKRQCNICYEVKDLNLENFYKDSTPSMGGFGYKCKECLKTLQRYVKVSDLTEEQKAKRKATTAKRKYKIKAQAHIYRDKKKGLISDVDAEFMKQCFEQPCIYCGFPSTGIDRKDNNIGHTKENCVPCCLECNVGRMDNFTHEEAKILGAAIRQIKLAREEKLK